MFNFTRSRRFLGGLAAVGAASVATSSPASPTGAQISPKAAVVATKSSVFIENAGQWDARAQFLSQVNGLNLWVTSEGPVFEFRKFIPTGVTHHSTEGSEPTEEEAISKGVAGSSSLLRLPGSPNGARILSEGRSPGNGHPLNSESPEGAKLPSLPGQGYIKGHVVKMTFINANPSAITGQSVQKSKFNYFLGNDQTKWVSNARSYAQVTAERPYDGISIRYSIDQGTPRYDVIVKPGADPSQVGIKIEGADDARVLENGNLELKTSLGTVEERGLTAYQETPNGRAQVPCKMVMDGNVVHFDTGGYDPAKTLVIDPLVASTYLGGSEYEIADGVALDSKNNIYVAGFTNSADFPTTVGSYQSSLAQSWAFVAKLDPTETSLIYSSVIGGAKVNNCVAIAVDSSGEAYLGGTTNSIDFPVTTGAFQAQNGTGANKTGFAAKLSASGSDLIYSTYLGGSVYESPYGIGLDSLGEAVIAGVTSSDDFPVTTGAYQTTNKIFTPNQQTYTGFVTKLNSTGTGLIYSTYLGGSGNSAHLGESIYGLALDGSGDAVVCGSSASPDFPITAGAYQTLDFEETDGFATCFITKLNSTGTQLVFSTFLGGSGNVAANFGEQGIGVALDSSDNVTVAGTTGSTDFPTTTGAYQTANPSPGETVSFVSKLNASGTALISSTYFAGAANYINALTVDSLGNAIFVGGTEDPSLPTSGDAYLAAYPFPSSETGFVSEISADGTKLIYSSYLGGNSTSGGDEAYAVALNGAGDAVVAGYATSSNFPTTAGAVEGNMPGIQPAFVTTLGISLFSSFTITPDPVVAGNPCTGSITLAHAVGVNTFVALSSSSAFVTVPSSVEILSGGVSSNFNITTSDATGEVYITATLGSSSQTVGISLVPNPIASVTISPTSVTGGNTATGTVQLNVAASQGNISVGLSSISPSIATVPLQVVIPQGATSATFPVSTYGVDSSMPVSIDALCLGQNLQGSFNVTPASVASLSASPTSVVGGSGATATVQLSGQAGPSGILVGISSNNPSVGAPTSVKVPSGASSVQFPITTNAVSSQSVVTLTASYNSRSQTSQITVTPATIASLGVLDSLALGSTTVTGTVQLSGPAGPSGDVIKLSSNTIRAAVPATLKVLAGQTTASFPINTTPVSSDTVATITATYGFSTQTTTLTVLPAPLSSLSASPTSVEGGIPASITVTLSGVAGPYGNVIKFAASSPALPLPATETIPAGESSHTFSVSTVPVSSTTVVTITDTFWVYSQTTTITVTPATLANLTLNPNPVVGGQTTTATILINLPAGPNGDVIKLLSNSSKAPVPATVTVLAGNTTAQFTVHTLAVSSNTQVTITATFGTSSRAAVFTLSP